MLTNAKVGSKIISGLYSICRTHHPQVWGDSMPSYENNSYLDTIIHNKDGIKIWALKLIHCLHLYQYLY